MTLATPEHGPRIAALPELVDREHRLAAASTSRGCSSSQGPGTPSPWSTSPGTIPSSRRIVAHQFLVLTTQEVDHPQIFTITYLQDIYSVAF